MEDTDPVDASWAAAAIDGLLAALGTELEAAVEAVADAKAEQRMGEILTHCIKAASLAMASQTILDHQAETSSSSAPSETPSAPAIRSAVATVGHLMTRSTWDT